MQLNSFGQLLRKSNLLLYSAEKCQKSSYGPLNSMSSMQIKSYCSQEGCPGLKKLRCGHPFWEQYRIRSHTMTPVHPSASTFFYLLVRFFPLIDKQKATNKGHQVNYLFYGCFNWPSPLLEFVFICSHAIIYGTQRLIFQIVCIFSTFITVCII